MTCSLDLKQCQYVGFRDNTGVKQSRLEIVAELLSLDSSYKFSSSGVANVEYDFVILEPINDVLLICYAEIVDPRQNHRLSVDQSFILRSKEHDEEDRCVHSFSYFDCDLIIR